MELDALWRRTYPGLVRLATLITGSTEAAHELTSDVFVRCHGRLTRIENPDAYLRTSVVNASRSWIRRAMLERRHQTQVHDEGITPPDSDIWTVLGALPWRQRAAIALRYHDDLNTDEIAASLGCAQATVRSLLHRGLAQLRKELAVDPIHVRHDGLLEDWGCDPPSPQGARWNCTVTLA